MIATYLNKYKYTINLEIFVQGYILNTFPVKDEDMIVYILTENSLKSTYRFYGARHSTIQVGYKIDFEPHHNIKSNIPMLRNVLHLAHPWNANRDRMLLWQQFVMLFYPHLKELGHLEGFYLKLLDWSALRWGKQNPKRVAIESYIKLLKSEGRLNREFNCFICNAPIKEEAVIARSFLPACSSCLHGAKIRTKTLNSLFKSSSSLEISDEDVENLWLTLLEGL